MNRKEFDSREPVCRFGPGGDFTTPWPAKPADEPLKWVSLLATTNDENTKIVITMPFLMTHHEVLKLSAELHEATKAICTKYLGPVAREDLIDFDEH